MNPADDIFTISGYDAGMLAYAHAVVSAGSMPPVATIEPHWTVAYTAEWCKGWRAAHKEYYDGTYLRMGLSDGTHMILCGMDDMGNHTEWEDDRFCTNPVMFTKDEAKRLIAHLLKVLQSI